MTKFVDDKGLKRYTDNMKLLLKKKVSKKRPYGQIVIGKSINPKSYDWGTIYAFRGNPCITIWSNNEVETFNIIIRDTTGTDKSTIYQSSRILLNNKKHLQEISIPGNNLTGTSKTYSWNNGKRVTSKKGTFNMACKILNINFTNSKDKGKIKINSYTYSNAIGVPYWKHGVYRSKSYRDKFPGAKKKYTRFTRKRANSISSNLGGGLWLVRFYDKKSLVYMNDVKVYVRKTKRGELIFSRT